MLNLKLCFPMFEEIVKNVDKYNSGVYIVNVIKYPVGVYKKEQ